MERSIQLPEETASKLERAADRLNISPELLAVISIDEKLAQLDQEFRTSADHVLQKNAELYRRLS